FHGRGMGSFHGWRLGILSGIRLHVCVALSLGMATVSLRELEFRAWIWLDVAARGLEQLANRSSVHGDEPPYGTSPGRPNRSEQDSCCGQDAEFDVNVDDDGLVEDESELRICGPGNSTWIG